VSEAPVSDLAARLGEELAANVEAELSLFDELRDLLEAERDHLVDLNADGLREVTELKEELVLRHKILEDARFALGQRLEEVVSGLEADASLAQIATALGGDLEKRLLELRGRLSVLVDVVSRMSDLNRRFTSHSLLCIQGGLALLRSGASDDKQLTYGATGRLAGRMAVSVAGAPVAAARAAVQRAPLSRPRGAVTLSLKDDLGLGG